MSPPLPPSPPEGPPRGTYFSRRNAIQPFPPFPPCTLILASSANTVDHQPNRNGAWPQVSAYRPTPWPSTRISMLSHTRIRVCIPHTSLDIEVARARSRGKYSASCVRRKTQKLVGGGGALFIRHQVGHQRIHSQHADEAAALSFVFEAHVAVDQREKRIVLGQRYVVPRLIPRAALPNQNASAGDKLAAKALDSQPLAVRIASVCR